MGRNASLMALTTYIIQDFPKFKFPTSGIGILAITDLRTEQSNDLLTMDILPPFRMGKIAK